jgi:hypothetical protein
MMLMRECIWHEYRYPNLKSRLKTYFLKLTTLIGGEEWKMVANFKIGSDKTWKYEIEILQAVWCKQIQFLIIRELKPHKFPPKKEDFQFR